MHAAPHFHDPDAPLSTCPLLALPHPSHCAGLHLACPMPDSLRQVYYGLRPISAVHAAPHTCTNQAAPSMMDWIQKLSTLPAQPLEQVGGTEAGSILGGVDELDRSSMRTLSAPALSGDSEDRMLIVQNMTRDS